MTSEKFVTCHQETNVHSVVCVCVKQNIKIKQGKKTCIFRGHRSQVYCIAETDWKQETQIFIRFDFSLVFFVPRDENEVCALIVSERAVRKHLGDKQKKVSFP